MLISLGLNSLPGSCEAPRNTCVHTIQFDRNSSMSVLFLVQDYADELEVILEESHCLYIDLGGRKTSHFQFTLPGV